LKRAGGLDQRKLVQFETLPDPFALKCLNNRRGNSKIQRF